MLNVTCVANYSIIHPSIFKNDCKPKTSFSVCQHFMEICLDKMENASFGINANNLWVKHSDKVMRRVAHIAKLYKTQ